MKENLTEKESLSIITAMIAQTKNSYQKGGSFHLLLWGWVIMFANFGYFLLAVVVKYAQPEIVWVVTLPAGMVSGIYGWRQNRNASVVNHIDRLYNHVWLACILAMVLTLVYMDKINYHHSPLILIFAAIGTYVSGVLLRFMPLIFGSLALVIAAVVGFNVSIPQQYLIAGFGILCGYLIPGYLLKSKEK